MALLEVESGECPSCHQPREESMAPENEFAYEPVGLQCHACAAIARQSRRIAEDEHHSHDLDGLSFTVNKKRS